MSHPFKDLVFDFIEDAIKGDPTNDYWTVERYVDYIRITRTRTKQVVLLTGFVLLEEDDVMQDPEDPFLLRAVRNEIEKGVPEEHE